MTTAVALFGLLIGGVGLVGVIRPTLLMAWIGRWGGAPRLWFAAGLRLVLGVVLVLAAPECRQAQVVRVLGWLTLIAAFALPLFGPRRFDAFVEWWLARSPPFIRAWSLLAVGLGGFLVFAGA